MTAPTTYRASHRDKGFTLIELMVTVFVLAILSVAALPFYRSFITSQRIKTASFDMMALITFTRSEAIKRNSTVTLGVSGGSFVVTTVVTSGGAPTTVTLRQEPMFRGILLDCVDMATRSYMACPGGMAYNSNGRLTSSFPPIEIHEPNANADPGASYRCITVDLGGRPNSRRGKC